MNIGDKLAAHLRGFTSAPFLFIGSGLSRRYLGLPDWTGLLRILAAPLSRQFEFYVSSANGDYARVATLLADEFHEVWWSSAEYEAQRVAFASQATDKSSALKIAATYALAKIAGEHQRSPDLEEELDLLRHATIDGIITTNWDLLLESLFPDFKVYVGQEELLFSDTQGVGETYKIHGTVSDPNSLIFTSADYEHFVAKYPYLAAKLLTVFVEHPVIFLGYSLSDENVQQILDSLASCLDDANIEKLANRLIFVQWIQEGPEDFASTIVSAGGKRIPVTLIRATSFVPIFRALTSIPRRLPARVLRYAKEHVYNLVKSNDPSGQLYVMDLDPAKDPREVEVVFGVGAIAKMSEIGYVGIHRLDLFVELVFEQSRFDARTVVSQVLPRLLTSGRHVPVFKYLRAAGFLDQAGGIAEGAVDPKVAAAASRDLTGFAAYPQYRNKREEIVALGLGVAGIEAAYGPELALMYVPVLTADEIDAKELRDFLQRNARFLKDGNSLQITSYRKLACIYDYLVYGPSASNGNGAAGIR